MFRVNFFFAFFYLAYGKKGEYIFFFFVESYMTASTKACSYVSRLFPLRRRAVRMRMTRIFVVFIPRDFFLFFFQYTKSKKKKKNFPRFFFPCKSRFRHMEKNFFCCLMRCGGFESRFVGSFILFFVSVLK